MENSLLLLNWLLQLFALGLYLLFPPALQPFVFDLQNLIGLIGLVLRPFFNGILHLGQSRQLFLLIIVPHLLLVSNGRSVLNEKTNTTKGMLCVTLHRN